MHVHDRVIVHIRHPHPRVSLLGDLVHIPPGRNSGQQRSFAVIPGIRALISGSLR